MLILLSFGFLIILHTSSPYNPNPLPHEGMEQNKTGDPDHFYSCENAQYSTGDYSFFVLFKNTRMSAEDILRICRQKDVDEKTFMHSRLSMEPLYARSD